MNLIPWPCTDPSIADFDELIGMSQSSSNLNIIGPVVTLTIREARDQHPHPTVQFPAKGCRISSKRKITANEIRVIWERSNYKLFSLLIRH
jgi:hypothetical protein